MPWLDNLLNNNENNVIFQLIKDVSSIIHFLKFIKLKMLFCRDEIASCMEKAYEKIAFSEAARMLFFESQKPMKQYATNVS